MLYPTGLALMKLRVAINKRHQVGDNHPAGWTMSRILVEAREARLGPAGARALAGPVGMQPRQSDFRPRRRAAQLTGVVEQVDAVLNRKEWHRW